MNAFTTSFAGEFRRILRDAGAWLVLLAAAIVYGLVYPIPYAHQVLKEVPTVVVDQDGTAASRRLSRMADASDLVRVVTVTGDEDAARSAIAAGGAGGALVIPRGFQRKLLRGEASPVTALGDASYFLVYKQVLAGLAGAAGTFSAGVEVRRLEATRLPQAAALARRDPLPLELRSFRNPAGGYASYVVPGVLILVLQQTLLIGLGSLGGAARESGTPPPAEERSGRRVAALLGRAAAYLPIYAVHVLFYLLIVYGVFGLPRLGGVGAALLFLLPFVLATTFLGIALADVFRRREAAMQALLFTSILALFVSGFAWPREALPAWLRVLALAVPSTQAIPGFIRIAQLGATLPQVGVEWGTLWVLTGVYFGIAFLPRTFYRRARRERRAGAADAAGASEGAAFSV